MGSDADGLGQEESLIGEGLTPQLIALNELAGRLLPEIERIEGDPKLECVVALVSKMLDTHQRKPRICIFTQFIDTAAYVADALGEVLPNVARLTGQVPMDKRAAITSHLANQGGVVVSTGATATYPAFDLTLFYDVPLSAARLNALMAHALRTAMNSPPFICAMLDTSRSLNIETLQRELLEGESPAIDDGAAMCLGELPNDAD
jgi:hypothetical protein